MGEDWYDFLFEMVIKFPYLAIVTKNANIVTKGGSKPENLKIMIPR